jgi:hypothetical protein
VAKSKVLSLSAMKKEDAKNHAEKKKILVKGYEVIIDKVFRLSEIRKLIPEVFSDLDALQKMEYDLQNFDINGYTLFIAMRYFTSLELPTTLEDKLAMMNIMIDNGFYEPIVNAFEEEEVRKLDQTLVGMVDELQSRVEKLKAEIEKTQESEAHTEENVVQ